MWDNFSVVLAKKPLSWFLERVQVWSPPPDDDADVDEDNEEEVGRAYGYEYQLSEYAEGVLLEANDDTGDTKYATHPYTLIQQYLSETPEEEAICLEVRNNCGEEKIWYITARGRRRFSLSMFPKMVQGAARFFRGGCCIVCGYDVLSEGGVHEGSCPVGSLLGPTYVTNRLFASKT